MKATVRYVRRKRVREASAPYLSDWIVVLDCDARKRRVRIMGKGNVGSLYVHVGDHVLFLQSSFAPVAGDTFQSLPKCGWCGVTIAVGREYCSAEHEREFLARHCRPALRQPRDFPDA